MTVQTELPLRPMEEIARRIEQIVCDVLDSPQQPSGRELVEKVEKSLGLKARWEIHAVVQTLSRDASLTRARRDYLQWLLESGELDHALRGEEAPDRDVVSSVDVLIHQSRTYRTSGKFAEMIEFMAKFRDYAPYNNMLVRLQNPSCGFYATVNDWQRRFGRYLKEDARPMLILAPMSPVMLVYDLDQTDGRPVPGELHEFSRFEGTWNPDWLKRSIENAARRDRIRVDFKPLSSTNAGFATLVRGSGDGKMRIAIHEGLDEPSRYGVLCHELAHIYLGHLGSDADRWWPSRGHLSHDVVEIEAETVAYIVTTRLGLKGASAAYVSRHLKDSALPPAVSLDFIAKIAGRIEQMAREVMEPRRRRDRQVAASNR